MDPRTWQAEDWSAFGSVGSLIVALVVGSFVWVQVLQAKSARVDQARPYVIVDFEFQRQLIRIAIKNIGSSPARNVSVKFDKPLQQSRRRGEVDVNESSVLKKPIPMIAPGRVISLSFDYGPDVFANEKLPLSYETTVTYDDVRGRHFEDPPFPLDLSPYKNAAVAGKGVQEIAQSLNDLHQDLKRLTRGSALRVKASDYDLE